MINAEPVEQQCSEKRCLEDGIKDSRNPAVHEECQWKHWICTSKHMSLHSASIAKIINNIIINSSNRSAL